MDSRVKFSIIIPVYNVEKYLRECLDSLVNQTFGDFEVICVNDGSTDNSLEILNEYAGKDGRFKVYSQENQGTGIARNYGLEFACGKYLLFVDPDDWVELNYLEILDRTFKETGVNVIQFGYKKINDISKEVRYYNYQKENKKFGSRKNLLKNPYFNRDDLKHIFRRRLMVWDKAYSLQFIRDNGIKFAPTRHGQDNLFSLGSVLVADKIFYLNEYLYNYRNRLGSAVNRKTKDRFCVFDNIRSLKGFLEEKQLFAEYSKAFEEYCLQQVFGMYNNIPEEFSLQYIEKAEEVLSKSNYKMFLRRIKNKGRTLPELIFSVRNRYDNLIKSKVVTILGFDFVIGGKKK